MDQTVRIAKFKNKARWFFEKRKEIEETEKSEREPKLV